MVSVKKVRIGIIGAGTVGRGVISTLRDQKELLQKRTGLDIEVIAVSDRSWQKKTDFLQGIPASDNPEIVLNNPEVDIVLELIGGLEPAGQYVEQALRKGKPVVTANKALLAKKGKEIFPLAYSQNLNIGFEAAVAGALPVIKSLRRSLVVNDIRAFYGILNGTCNFIISKMESDGMDYAHALELAQRLGFAEADPSFDVNGNDAAQKLALLAGLSFDTFVPEETVFTEGISRIRKVDLDIVASMGKVVRLLGIARRFEDGSSILRVHPAIIPGDHILGHVKDERNAVYFDTSHSGPVLIMGSGAGANPTAAAVISDIVFIARSGEQVERWMAGDHSLTLVKDLQYSFYLRFQTMERPGVLADIARVLADHGISIARFHQEEGEEPVQVVVMTHHASESRLAEAVRKIDEMPIVLEPTTVIRMLDQL